MSMATNRHGKKFTNSVRYLRDEIEPLFQGFYYEPVQIENFLHKSTGPENLKKDLTVRETGKKNKMTPEVVDYHIQQYSELFAKDNSKVRGIGRRFGHMMSSYGSGRLGNTLGIAGAVLGGIYTVFANYDMPDPSICFLNDCGPNPYLGKIEESLYHVKDVVVGGGIGYVAGRVLGAVTGRMFRRNSSQQTP